MKSRHFIFLTGIFILAGIFVPSLRVMQNKEGEVLLAKSKKIKNNVLCNDSDSKKSNPKFTKGIVISKTHGTYYDKCTMNKKQVHERWCYEDGKVGDMIYNCKKGCRNGACKR